MSRLPGPSQTPLSPVVPGEPLSQTLVNQIIGGSNNARMVSGDKGVEVTNIGGLFGISLNAKPGQDRGVVVEIQPTSDIANGFYRGRLYTQSQIFFGAGEDGTLTTAQTPRPAPEVNSCYIVNLAQVDPAYLGSGDTTSYSYGVTQITQRRMAVGRVIGQMNSMGLDANYPPAPLVAVDVPTSSSGFATGTITAHGTITGTSWNYTAQSYDGLTTYGIVRNGMEPCAGIPGRLGINVGTDGSVDGGSCIVQPIGVAAEVLMWPDPTVMGGWVFSCPNSAQ